MYSFGYDSGYISGVLGMGFFTETFGHAVAISDESPNGFALKTS